MISLVLDGRNDAHGHNSHKRVAISLNCLASVLNHEHDEIVFVDYNSPDDVPTLPEIIEDLLTDHAKRKLRILRVVPSVHRRLALPGSGNLLDVIARNVGIRRTNPANRWILSTTSDIVVVPHPPRSSLTEICGDLPDGFYALPRFEVPEFLWETTNRHKPDLIKASFAEWGRRLHLHEAVLGVPEVLFDACGDFQLFLRQDIFAIAGFDERMIAGWQHSDANLQRRLAIWRGGVIDFSQWAFAYHCDHMRQAAPVHSRQRLENDWEFFVHGIHEAKLPFQSSDWGLPDEAVREVSLPKPSSSIVISALANSLAPASSSVRTSSRDHSSYDLACVPTSHILSFVVDQLANYLPFASVGYVGINGAFLCALARVAEGLDGGLRIIVAKQALLDEATRGQLAMLSSVHFNDQPDSMDGCHLCIFDFSVHRPDAEELTYYRDLNGEEARRLSAVRALLVDEAGRERQRTVSRSANRRKFVAVNAIHTSFEELIDSELEAALTPFSTRIRHGYVRPNGRSSDVGAADLVRALSDKIGRPVLMEEASLVLSIVGSVRRGQPVQAIPEWMITRALQGLLELPKLVEACSLQPNSVSALHERCKAVFGSKQDGFSAPAYPRAASRMCNFSDWEDPEWRVTAGEYGHNTGQVPYHRRHRSSWERVQMVHVTRNAEAKGRRAAVMCVEPDELCDRLVQMGHQVDTVLYRKLGDDNSWRMIQDDVSHSRAPRLVRDGAHPGYSVVYVPQNTAFLHGALSLEDIVRRAEDLVVDNGLLVFSAELVTKAWGPHPWWAAEFDECRAVAHAFAQSTRFRVVGLPVLASQETLSRRASLADALAARPHAVVVDRTHERTSSVWVCRRVAVATAERLPRLAAFLSLKRNLLFRMRAAPPSSWQSDALRLESTPLMDATAQIDDLLLPAAKLRAILHGTIGQAQVGSVAIVDLLSKGRVVRSSSKFVLREMLSAVYAFDFECHEEGPFTIRLTISGGQAEFNVHRVQVELMPNA